MTILRLGTALQEAGFAFINADTITQSAPLKVYVNPTTLQIVKWSGETEQWYLTTLGGDLRHHHEHQGIGLTTLLDAIATQSKGPMVGWCDKCLRYCDYLGQHGAMCRVRVALRLETAHLPPDPTRVSVVHANAQASFKLRKERDLSPDFMEGVASALGWVLNGGEPPVKGEE